MARKNSKSSKNGGNGSLRPLTVDDLDQVVAIDRTLSGRSRRGFFETRLKGALRDPKRFLFVGVCEDHELIGFVLARLLEGEFGGEAPVAVLDAIGLDPGKRGKGYGRRLMTGLEEVMRQKNVRELQSQLDWNNHALMGFLDAAGFRLAPRVVLSRPIAHGADF
jgi:ribosomal protein S18 acetylase RimI-like enzyme